MTGGGMRQAGILAAAGLYALKNNVARLKDDHDNAAWMAAQLREIGADVMRHDTNMLFVRAGEIAPLRWRIHEITWRADQRLTRRASGHASRREPRTAG
jgi:threonine aldolase